MKGALTSHNNAVSFIVVNTIERSTTSMKRKITSDDLRTPNATTKKNLTVKQVSALRSVESVVDTENSLIDRFFFHLSLSDFHSPLSTLLQEIVSKISMSSKRPCSPAL